MLTVANKRGGDGSLKNICVTTSSRDGHSCNVPFVRGDQSAAGNTNEALKVSVVDRRVQMAVCQV
jgi:hypothetical protein